MKYLSFLAFLAATLLSVHAGWKLGINHEDFSYYERGDEAYVDLTWQGPEAISAVPSFALFDQLGRQIQALPVTKNADRWKISIPTNRLGYFEVRPIGADAEALIPALGSRPAGRLTLAVVEKINRNPSYDFTCSYLSLQGTTILNKTAGKPAFGWDAYPYFGAQTWGIGYHWSDLEPEGPGTFEKNIANDPNPKWVRDLKIVPYFNLNAIPMWAADASRLPEKERGARNTQRVPPRDWAQWEAFLEKLIPYLAKSYSFLPERVYEVMWEPMIPWGWYGTPEEIVKTFEIAHKVIHKYDPNGKVAGPTLSGLNDREYFETLLKAGLGRYLDVVSFHPYKGYPPESSGIPESLQGVRDLTRQYVGRELPFIGTEYGYPESTTGSALNQAYGLAASVLIFKGEGATKHTLFYLADYAGEPGYGMNYNLIAGLPFGPSKISPKPAVPLVRAAIDQVGRTDVIGKLDYLGAGIWGYVYKDKKDGTILAALWDSTEQNRTITFDAGMPKVEVVDLFGNREFKETSDGRISLQLGRGATYVRGLSEQLYGTGRILSLLDTPKVWKLYRGKKATQPVSFTRDMGKGEFKLNFDTIADINRDRVQIPIPAEKGKKAEVSFDVSPKAPLGRAPGYIRISADGKRIYSGIQPVEVVPELEIGTLKTQFQSGKWLAVASVRNTSPYDWNGKMTLKLEGDNPLTQAFSIAMGQEKTIRFDVEAKNAARSFPALLEFNSDGGFSLNQKGLLTFYVIQKRPEDADFWSKMRKTELHATSDSIWRISHGSAFHGDKDLSATIAYAYDETNVYVEVNVTDDIHLQDSPEGSTWSRDSVQLGFDVFPGREANSNVLAETNARTSSEWTIAWTPRGPELYLNMAPGGSTVPENTVVRSQGVLLSGGVNGDRTLYRVTLPWKLLDPKGQRSRLQIGVSAAINDSDRPVSPSDRRGLEFFGGILRGKNSALYGAAFLE